MFPWQIDEQGDEQGVEAPKKKPKKERERPFSVETKYKGYEELLDVDTEDPDIVVPKDLQGSVRALNYALAHPLIFSEPHGTYKERRVKKIKVSKDLMLFVGSLLENASSYGNSLIACHPFFITTVKLQEKPEAS